MRQKTGASFIEENIVLKIYEEKEMIPLTDEENKSYKEQKACNICNGGFCYDENKKRI